MDAALIEKQALLLPETERALLVERLMESISPCPSALRKAWIREADQRMRAFREGEITAVDGPQALAELRAQFSK